MRKMLSIILSLALLVSVNSVAFAASPTKDTLLSSYTIATVQDSLPSANTQNEVLSISDLNELSKSDLQHYDFILLDEPLLSELTKEAATTFLQSGGVLGVETSSTDNVLSELYNLLDVEKPVTIQTDGVLPIAAYITMRNGQFVPGIISQGTVSSPDITELTSVLENIINSESLCLYDKIDINNFLDFINTSKTFDCPVKSPSPSDISPMMAPSGFDFEFDNYVSFKSNKIGNNIIGSVAITQYVYEICSYRSGSSTVKISDVVSHIVVDSGDLSYVKTYDSRMGVDGSSMSIIDQTYLNSNSNKSISLSGGFSASSDDIISGNVSASTTYTYDTNDQTITNDFPSNKYSNWESDPTENWPNASWVLDPGIRVKNSNASRYDSSVYTSVEEVAFKWHYMGAQSGTEVHTSPLEVGGEW